MADFRPFNQNFISNSLYYIIETFLTLQMENEGKLKGIFLMRRGIAPFTRFVKPKCMYNIRINEYTEYKLKELTRLTVVLNLFVL